MSWECVAKIVALTLSCRFFIRGEPPNKNAAKYLSLRERDFESGSLLPEGAVRYGRGSPAHKSGVFIRGFPPDKKTTRQRNKREGLGMRATISATY